MIASLHQAHPSPASASLDSMPTAAPREDPDDRDLTVRRPERAAAGLPGVVHGLAPGVAQMGVARSARTLLKLNRVGGFDCPGGAWPEPGPARRGHAEFCENGAKAVAEEATLRRVTPAFFAVHSVADLAGRSDHWLGQQGRLTTPMVLEPGGTHYTPTSWSAAFALVAARLNRIAPDEAAFYTSGRTSNEAAFLYQLFARAYGTNNLPDCSNMCHESSGVALSSTIGVGKGTVTLEDIHRAALLVIVGQNPGTNHPRMLSALEQAKRNAARIIAVNPLPEAGLIRFRNPKRPSGLVGTATALADRYLQTRAGGRWPSGTRRHPGCRPWPRAWGSRSRPGPGTTRWRRSGRCAPGGSRSSSGSAATSRRRPPTPRRPRRRCAAAS